MTSDSDVNSANKRLPLTLSDAGFGESDRVEMHHIASTRSSLGLKADTSWFAVEATESEGLDRSRWGARLGHAVTLVF